MACVSDPPEELGSRLTQAKLWCDVKRPYADRNNALRTPDLKPDLPKWPAFADLDSAITILTQRREEILARLGSHNVRPVHEIAGKLLICALNQTVWDGASEAETEGFFDVCDRPPWDTWIFCAEEELREKDPLLFSWVPSELVSLVASGINVNPVDCIYWASSVDTELTRRLRAQGLLT